VIYLCFFWKAGIICYNVIHLWKFFMLRFLGKIILFLIIFWIPFSTFAYSYITKVVDGHRVRIFHIPYNDRYRVKAVATNTSTSLQSLIRTGRGVAGINGAYFIPRDFRGNPDITNAVRIINGAGYIYSRYFPDTGISGIFGFLYDYSPILVQNNMYGTKSLRENINALFLWNVESGIANYPILLANGIDIVPEYNALGLISEDMLQESVKSFICRTWYDDVKMGTIDGISMLDVPGFIRQFGCVDAINLDAGRSLAMYDKGKYIISPGRGTMDAFIIVRK